MVLLRHDMVGRLLIAVVWCKDIRGGGGGGDHIGIRRIGSPIIEAEEMGGGGGGCWICLACAVLVVVTFLRVL